jgi:hypothetical protein
VSVSVLVIANRSGGARGGDEGERESGMRALRTAREREREGRVGERKTRRAVWLWESAIE